METCLGVQEASLLIHSCLKCNVYHVLHFSCTYTCMHACMHAGSKESLVIDYNMLASERQTIAFFLPEAPSEMFKIFDEVSMFACSYLLQLCSCVSL